jgi:hypothetical protein
MKKPDLRKSSSSEAKNNSLSQPPLKRIKVKLDARTTIMINRPSSLKVWKRIYPMAEVVYH